MSMNNADLIGRLTKDITNNDIRYTRSGVAVVHFMIAVDRNYKDRQGNIPADFIPCKLWGRGGQQPSNNNVTTLVSGVTKGSRIGIDGRIETGRYRDRSGQYRYTWDVRVDDYTFCDSKPQNTSAPQNGTADPFSTPATPRKPKAQNPFATPKVSTSRPAKKTADPFAKAKANTQKAVTGADVKGGKVDISEDDLPF